MEGKERLAMSSILYQDFSPYELNLPFIYYELVPILWEQ
jgi:hypothetical protein